MAGKGFPPSTVRGMELWEVAAVMGLHRADALPEPEVDIVAMRMQAHKEGRPPPTLADVSAARRAARPTLRTVAKRG